MEKLRMFVVMIMVIVSGLYVYFYVSNIMHAKLWYVQIFSPFYLASQLWLIAQAITYAYFTPFRSDYGKIGYNPLSHTRIEYQQSHSVVLSKSQDKDLTVVVSTYNEPLESLVQTFKNLRKNFSGPIILADDSGKYAQELGKECINLGIDIVHRNDRGGYKAGALNHALRFVRTKYVAFFDSDAIATREFFELAYKYMNDYDFVIFPQYYYNHNDTRVSYAAFSQQIPFMTHIMVKRGLDNTAFMLGTNMVARKDALESIGGFDQSTITEDLATSIRLHRNNCRSIYVPANVVMNRAPTRLKSYFIQQERWAHGTTEIFFKYLKSGLGLGFKRNFEYLFGASWYFYGFVWLIQVLGILFYGYTDDGLFLFGTSNAKEPLLNHLNFLLMYLPFVAYSFGLFLVTIKRLGYGFKEAFYNNSVNAISFYVYMRAVLKAAAGKKIAFGRTPKKEVSSRTVEKYKALTPHLLMISALLFVMFNLTGNIMEGKYLFASIYSISVAGFMLSLLSMIFFYEY